MLSALRSVEISHVAQAHELTMYCSEQYVCHHNSMLIYGSLERPTLDRYV